MRVYISGPITGQEKTAYDRFLKAEVKIWRAYGHETETINPEKIGEALGRHAELTHAEYMKISFEVMKLCDAVYFMPGWSKSKGCQEELTWAQNLGMTILEESAKE